MFGSSIFILIIICIISLVVLVFSIFGLFKLFKKAGYKGWEAFVPGYNLFVLTKIAKLNIVWFIVLVICLILSLLLKGILLSFAEIILLFVNANLCFNLSKITNKGLAWTLASLIFGFITIPLLGIINSTSISDTYVSEWGLFGNSENKGDLVNKDVSNNVNNNNVINNNIVNNNININLEMPKMNHTPKTTSVLSEGFVPIIDNKSIKNDKSNENSTNNEKSNDDMQEFKSKLFNDESNNNNSDSTNGNYFY